MKVILKENLDNVGNMGDVINVKPGYARNYLIPKDYAVIANQKNIKALEHEQRIIQERARKILDANKSLAEKIEAVTLSFKAKAGEEDKLFGSITSMDIAEALEQQGIEVDKKKVVISDPIKRLGEHTVEVKVGPEVKASIKVQVEAE